MSEYRLGDDIDDFCVRCKRLTNHLVVSVMNGGPAKVRCRSCHSDHDYRHEQAPPKVESRKQALFNEVLKKTGVVDVPSPAIAADLAPPPEPPAAEIVAAVPAAAEPDTAEKSAKPKAKAKSRK